jgi:hypothetical protein
VLTLTFELQAHQTSVKRSSQTTLLYLVLLLYQFLYVLQEQGEVAALQEAAVVVAVAAV